MSAAYSSQKMLFGIVRLYSAFTMPEGTHTFFKSGKAIKSQSIKILPWADNADMILFDENFNYLKHGNNNNVSSDFQSGKIYYIALICYGDKSITKRYSVHYKFN